MLGLLKKVLVGETPMSRLKVQCVGLWYLLAEISVLAAKNRKKTLSSEGFSYFPIYSCHHSFLLKMCNGSLRWGGFSWSLSETSLLHGTKSTHNGPFKELYITKSNKRNITDSKPQMCPLFLVVTFRVLYSDRTAKELTGKGWRERMMTRRSGESQGH